MISCIIRKISIVHTPEEFVRQKTLRELLLLGYPQSLITVERKLAHLSSSPKVPNRRIDILCYGMIEKALQPLLLIECKVKAKYRDTGQLFGYNHFIQSEFLSVIDSETVYITPSRTAIAAFPYTSFLPKYDALIDWLIQEEKSSSR